MIWSSYCKILEILAQQWPLTYRTSCSKEVLYHLSKINIFLRGGGGFTVYCEKLFILVLMYLPVLTFLTIRTAEASFYNVTITKLAFWNGKLSLLLVHSTASMYVCGVENWFLRSFIIKLLISPVCSFFSFFFFLFFWVVANGSSKAFEMSGLWQILTVFIASNCWQCWFFTENTFRYFQKMYFEGTTTLVITKLLHVTLV